MEADGQARPAQQERSGEMLRRARDAQGLSLDDVGARTRVPLRHLEAIEAGTLDALPSSTYAVGFARAYARAVGADEVAVAAAVRAEVARLGRRQPEYEPYVTADPERVPSRGLAAVALGLALAVVVLAGLYFATDWFRPELKPTAPGPSEAMVASVPAAPAATPPSAAPAGGQVTLEALDEVWLRVHDANRSLFLGTMKAGDRFDVPRDAAAPQIDVGRPDKLRVTLNGSAAPALGTGERPVKNVAVDGASVAARLNGPAPSPSASPSPSPTVSASAGARPAARTPRPAPRPRRRGLTETQRANLEQAASHAAAPAASPTPGP